MAMMMMMMITRNLKWFPILSPENACSVPLLRQTLEHKHSWWSSQLLKKSHYIHWFHNAPKCHILHLYLLLYLTNITCTTYIKWNIKRHLHVCLSSDINYLLGRYQVCNACHWYLKHFWAWRNGKWSRRIRGFRRGGGKFLLWPMCSWQRSALSIVCSVMHRYIVESLLSG